MLGEMENDIFQSTTTRFNIPINTNLDHIIKNEMDFLERPAQSQNISHDS